MTSPTNKAALPLSLVEMATRQVRSEVLSGALEPGSRVVEETLCARLGISRAPVREALRLLAQQGLGPEDVLNELDRRFGLSGLEEKANRDR